MLIPRYTDFLVNEILPSGEVLHLKSVATPSAKDEKKEEPAETPAETGQEAKAEFELSDEDKAFLESHFGPGKTKKMVSLHKQALANSKARPSDLYKVSNAVTTDRDVRAKIHQAIRRIFNSQLESSTDKDGNMTVGVAPNRNNKDGGKQGRVNWDDMGGSFLHFTIYKENKDTMETVNFAARQLKVNPKVFNFAGTKDRRGVTVQRASANRILAERLAKLNSSLKATLGDFEYKKQGLELGDLNGNEFVITLRDCEIPGVDLTDRETAIAKTKELVGQALRNLHERGYINYYGLQRFGTFAISTDVIGRYMLQSDFKGACDAILHYSPHVLAAAEAGDESTAMVSALDKARAKGIHIFKTTGKANDALNVLPRKFAAETSIIRHLGRVPNDHLSALQGIYRNLRSMYLNAYQSLVWNHAAGERWRLYGDKVVEGDLVMVDEHKDKEANAPVTEGPPATVDADGEVIIRPEAEDSSYAADDMFARARALTADEAASGKYSIFDIVLPLPGFDIIYPVNELTDFYTRFMGSEQGGGLDPFNMRRKWKDISMPGGYRKMLSRMLPEHSFDVKWYSDPDQQLVQTDLETVTGKTLAVDEGAGDRLAVILKFQLGSSQYATMAMRELMKGKAKSFMPDFSGGR